MLPRTVTVVPRSDPKDPATRHLVFYGGAIDVGVDAEDRFVGMKVAMDLEPDEPLYVPDEFPKPRAWRDAPDVPLQILLGRNDRVIGVHVLAAHRLRRIGDAGRTA